jgi:hypothetical protein
MRSGGRGGAWAARVGGRAGAALEVTNAMVFIAPIHVPTFSRSNGTTFQRHDAGTRQRHHVITESAVSWLRKISKLGIASRPSAPLDAFRH